MGFWNGDDLSRLGVRFAFCIISLPVMNSYCAQCLGVFPLLFGSDVIFYIIWLLTLHLHR